MVAMSSRVVWLLLCLILCPIFIDCDQVVQVRKSGFSLKCYGSTSIRWYKDRHPVTLNGTTRRTRLETIKEGESRYHGRYYAHWGQLGDVGRYECRDGDNHTIDRFVMLDHPVVRMEGEASANNGDTWRVRCRFASAANALAARLAMGKCSVADGDDRGCREGNATEMVDTLRRLVKDNPDRMLLIANDTLVELAIRRVTYGDVARYICLGHNQLSTRNDTTFLRLKDRLQILWPMTMLLGLMLHLFALVFIYETRRARATSLIKVNVDDPTA